MHEGLPPSDLSHGKRSFTSTGRAPLPIPPVFGEHMPRHAYLLLAVAAAVLCPARRLPPAGGAPCPGRSACRRSSSTSTRSASLKARFVQSNPNGSRGAGHALSAPPRPHALRVRRTLAAQDRGRRLSGDDVGQRHRDFGQWPIGWTAASFLVKDPLQLVGRPAGREARCRVNGLLGR